MIARVRNTMYQLVRIISDRRYHPFDWLPHIHHTAPANSYLPSTCRFLSQDFCNVFRPRPCFHTLDMNTLLLFMMLWSSPCEFLCKRYENTSSLSHPHRRLFLQAQPQSESGHRQFPSKEDALVRQHRAAVQGSLPRNPPIQGCVHSLLASCLNSGPKWSIIPAA